MRFKAAASLLQPHPEFERHYGCDRSRIANTKGELNAARRRAWAGAGGTTRVTTPKVTPILSPAGCSKRCAVGLGGTKAPCRFMDCYQVVCSIRSRAALPEGPCGPASPSCRQQLGSLSLLPAPAGRRGPTRAHFQKFNTPVFLTDVRLLRWGVGTSCGGSLTPLSE